MSKAETVFTSEPLTIVVLLCGMANRGMYTAEKRFVEHACCDVASLESVIVRNYNKVGKGGGRLSAELHLNLG
jgi:hypothetical protein